MTNYIHGATRNLNPLQQVQATLNNLARAYTDLANKYETIAADNRTLKQQVADLQRTPPAFIGAPVKVRPLHGSVPATKARGHIEYLHANGVQGKDIAAVTGISKQLISKIKTGNVERVSATAEALILAVQPNKEPS